MSGEKRKSEKSDRKYFSEPENPCKIFVGGLTRETTADMLKGYFSYYGRIAESIILTDPITEKSRGFGFVTFENPDAVDYALASAPHYLDGKTIDPKRLLTRHFLRKSNSVGGQRNRVFLGGLPLDINENELKEFFSTYGEVTESVIIRDDKSSKSRGFGFVAFQDESVIDILLVQHHIEIRDRRVEVKLARPGSTIMAPSNPPASRMNAPVPYPIGVGGGGPRNFYPNAGYPQFPDESHGGAKRMRYTAADVSRPSNYPSVYGGGYNFYPQTGMQTGPGQGAVQMPAPGGFWMLQEQKSAPVPYAIPVQSQPTPVSYPIPAAQNATIHTNQPTTTATTPSFDSMRQIMEQASQQSQTGGNDTMNIMVPLMMTNMMLMQQLQSASSQSGPSNTTGEMMDMMKKLMQQMLEKTAGSGSKEIEKKGE